MKRIFIFFCLWTLLLTSCEDLVDIDDPANQIGTAQVFTDVQTANTALAGLYAELRDRSLIGGGSYIGTSSLLGIYTDDLDCYNTDQNGLMDIYRNQQLETNGDIKDLWDISYGQIYYANSIIYGIEQSAGLSGVEKNRIKGEALLIRSLVYFYLQQLFGDIPYTTGLDYEYNRHINKTNATAVLELLEADVTEAASLLDDDYRDTERIYINRKAAQLLLARICLLQKEWSMAEQMANVIIQSPLYEFQVNISEVFHKSGKHILWQLKPENDGDPTREATFYYFSGIAPNAYALTKDLTDTFSDDDLRKQAWMAEVTFNGNYWFRPFKYKNKDNGTNTNEYSVIFRLAEVYYIMAEALAAQNRFDEALPYLNATRERAGLTAFTSLSEDEFIDELMDEKRREFFTEFGHRFLDLKRQERLNELSAVKPNWKAYKQVLPLPKNELLLNPNLTPQNTGY